MLAKCGLKYINDVEIFNYYCMSKLKTGKTPYKSECCQTTLKKTKYE